MRRGSGAVVAVALINTSSGHDIRRIGSMYLMLSCLLWRFRMEAEQIEKQLAVSVPDI
jgi:hypothetical protein